MNSLKEILTGKKQNDIKIFIGPHIGPHSFFVKEDVLNLFLGKNNFNLRQEEWLIHENNLFQINLLQILVKKLTGLGVAKSQIFSFQLIQK